MDKDTEERIEDEGSWEADNETGLEDYRIGHGVDVEEDLDSIIEMEYRDDRIMDNL